MTERERLIELLKHDSCQSPMLCDPNCQYANLQRCYEERTADYLLENGVILLPCKVGDTVYEVIGKCNEPSNYCALNGGYGTYRCSRSGYKCEAYIEEIKFSISLIDFIGKSIFTTREEAEKVLENLKENA